MGCCFIWATNLKNPLSNTKLLEWSTKPKKGPEARGWSKFQKSSSCYFRKWAAVSFEVQILKIRWVITKLLERPTKPKKGPGARGWSKFQKSSSYYLRKWAALSFGLWIIKIRWIIIKLLEWPTKPKKGPWGPRAVQISKKLFILFEERVALSFELWTIKIRWVITKLFEFLLKVLQRTDRQLSLFLISKWWRVQRYINFENRTKNKKWQVKQYAYPYGKA